MTIDEVIAHCEDVVNTNKELCERDNDYYKNQVQIQSKSIGGATYANGKKSINHTIT